MDALAVFNGDLIAGGDFTYRAGSGEGEIARWDGTRWWQLGNGIGTDLSIPSSSTVFDLEVYNGDLIVAGWFKYANGWLTGFRVNNIARWDGTNWHSMGLGLNNTVSTLTTYNGYLIASGLFTQAGDWPADYIARWDGNDWAPMPGLNGNVSSFATYRGDLIAVGSFNRAGGQPAPYIARWDGIEWSPFGTRKVDLDGVVVWNDSLIANAYYVINGYTHRILSWWDGTDWQPLGAGFVSEIGPVYSFAVYNERLVAAGRLYTGFHNIARWDGGTWNPLGSGVSSDRLDGAVRDLAVRGGSLYVAGRFNSAGGKPSLYIARWDDVITPVSVEELAVTPDGPALRITWRLSEEAVRALGGIGVERAEDRAGPYDELTQVPLLPAVEMEFTDAAIEPGRQYWYRLRLLERDGSESFAGPVAGLPSLESRFAILYPPVDPSADRPVTFRYRITGPPTPVRLEIYTASGRLLRVLDSGVSGPGEHLLSWDRRSDAGPQASRGVYLVRLSADRGQATRKLVLLHR